MASVGTTERAWRAGAVLIVFLVACSGDDGGDAASGGRSSVPTDGSASSADPGGAGPSSGGATPGRTSEVTWYEDVAPIVYENCVACHRPGEIAPFSLLDYEQASSVASLVAQVTRERRMPPMPVDNTGECNTYSNARWLTDDEIATIQAWFEGGAAMGDPENALSEPPGPADLADPDAVLDAGVDYLPDASRPDDYRCFVLPSPVEQSQFLTAYQVVPGDARIVHHVIVYHPTSDTAAEEARALDEAEEGPGYTCFGSPGVSAEPRVLWAPGTAAVRMPAGTGTVLAGGRDLILQIHYNTLPGSFPDRTSVKLEISPTVGTQAQFIPIADLEMQLQPLQAQAVTTASFSVDDPVPVTLYGALPHMHTLGHTLEVTATSSGTDQCLVKVDRWDFHWQNAWWYAEPLKLPAMDSIRITCGYDTRSRTDVVTWGDGTADEMCLAYFYLSAP